MSANAAIFLPHFAVCRTHIRRPLNICDRVRNLHFERCVHLQDLQLVAVVLGCSSRTKLPWLNYTRRRACNQQVCMPPFVIAFFALLSPLRSAAIDFATLICLFVYIQYKFHIVIFQLFRPKKDRKAFRVGSFLFFSFWRHHSVRLSFITSQLIMPVIAKVFSTGMHSRA